MRLVLLFNSSISHTKSNPLFTPCAHVQVIEISGPLSKNRDENAFKILTKIARILIAIFGQRTGTSDT